MIYLSPDDNTTKDAVKRARGLIANAHAILDGLSGRPFKSEFDGIFHHLERAFKSIEDLEFNQGE